LFRDEGLTVVEVGDWRHHNRNHVGAWGPVHGVMIHHTVTSGSARTVQICRDGYSGLPGPLCHGVITKDGRVHLVGYGRTNHAGSGDGDVLRAVIAERALPADNEATTDGNRHFYGFECENLGDGKDPWPQAQLDAIEKVSAAICRYHGWGAGSVIGHLEWQPGKVDPRGFSMQTMRGRIAARLDGNQSEEDTVALTDSEIERIVDGVYEAVCFRDGRIKAPNPQAKNRFWMASSYWRDTYISVRRIETAVNELLAQGAARDAVLARLAEGGGLDAAEIQAAAEAGAQAALDRLGDALRDDV
jgi:hypothetical protein